MSSHSVAALMRMIYSLVRIYCITCGSEPFVIIIFHLQEFQFLKKTGIDIVIFFVEADKHNFIDGVIVQ